MHSALSLLAEKDADIFRMIESTRRVTYVFTYKIYMFLQVLGSCKLKLELVNRLLQSVAYVFWP